jgi:cytochrome c biogenesis protein CcdA
MENVFMGLISAIWLGILTSISPCPLATNIAAISFLSKKIVHPRAVLLSGFAYTAGRMAAYAALGFILIYSILSVPVAANFLQKYMAKALGPILIFTGLFLLDIIKFRFPSFSLHERHHHALADSGVPGAFALGFIFALAFCPVSAALFFGSLIPLALDSKIGAVLPLIYGVGTGLPVLIFAFLISEGVASLSHWFRRLTKVEYYMRRITGAVFIVVGLYYVSIYFLKIF